MNWKNKVLIAVACYLSQSIFAENITSSIVYLPSTQPLIRVYDLDGVNFSAFIEGNYNYLSEKNQFISGINNRSYDLNENGISLQQLVFLFARQPKEGFGGVLNTMLGADSYANASYGAQPLFDSQNAGLDFTQVYGQYATHGFTFVGGKFMSTSGYESIFSPQNNIVSLSLLATYTQAGTYTGMKMTYSPTSAFLFVAGINDGWDNVRDWSRRKTIETGGTYTASDGSTLAAYITNGQERANYQTDTGPIGMRTSLDIVGVKILTDSLSLIANYDYVTQSVATLPGNTLGLAIWQGIAGYINYQFNSNWNLSLRAEFFNDPTGYATGVKQNLKEGTITLGYLFTKKFQMRIETRRDFSDTNSFQSKSGNGTSNQMQSFSLTGILAF